MAIWSMKKHNKSFSLEASHYYVIFENNVWLFEDRNSVSATESIPYTSARQFAGDSCLKQNVKYIATT